MTIKIYTATVKHIEKTMYEFISEDLEQVLHEVQSWREDSNKAQDYDLYITDNHGCHIFGTRF